MKITISLCLAAVLMLGGGEGGDAKKEIDGVKGTWVLSDLTYNGKDHGQNKFNVVFKGDEATVEGNDRVKIQYARLTLKFDPSTTPKMLDLTVTDGSQQGAVVEGIYELKGNELRICAKVIGKERPTEFQSPAGSNVVLLVLKRE